MRTSVLFSLLLGGVILAQPTPQTFTVKGDFTVQEWTIGKLKVDKPTENASYVWDVFPVHPLLDDAASVIELGDQLLFTGPPGRYRVVCTEIVMAGTKPAITRQRGTISVLAQSPNPPNPGPIPPNPTPPDPKPVPPDPLTPTEMAVIIIEETAEARANRGAFLADSGLYVFFKNNGHIIRVADKDSVKDRADWQQYLKLAQGKQLPCAIMVPKSGGQVRFVGDLPNSPNELIDLMKKKGAKSN